MILSTRSSSTTPPRPREDFKRIPASVPSNIQLEIATLLTPPDISLPITTPPCPESIIQLVIVIFSQAFPYLRPSASRPDFIVMQSSPTLMKQSEMRTFRHEVGLIPSVLGPFGFSDGLCIVTPCTTTSSQNAGLIVQKGEFIIFTFSISIFVHS